MSDKDSSMPADLEQAHEEIRRLRSDETYGLQAYQMNCRALDDAGVPKLSTGADETECFTSKRIRHLAAERDALLAQLNRRNDFEIGEIAFGPVILSGVDSESVEGRLITAVCGNLITTHDRLKAFHDAMTVKSSDPAQALLAAMTIVESQRAVLEALITYPAIPAGSEASPAP